MIVRREHLELLEDGQSLWDRVGILAGVLVREASELSEAGWVKHVQVREAIKAAVFGGTDEEALEHAIDELIPLSGWAEWATDRALDFLPLERILNAVLDVAIKAAYNGMKRAGMTVHGR